MVRARILAVAAAALTVGLAACSAGGSNADGPGSVIQDPPANSAPAESTSTDSGTPAETTAPAAGSTTARPDQQPDSGLCKAPDLQLSFGKGGAAAGTAYRPLIFTNTSGHRCVIQGFPGVSYVGGNDGHQVGAAASRVDEKGPPITLEPGEQASAVIGYVAVENYEPENCRPEPVRGLRIYPPQETASMYIEFDYAETGCTNDKVHQLSVQTMKPGRGDR
ncbi:DUF4232 domain-containing protein [Saccharopolyspora elongata]|uniref:DUF4232 domain-containing protein n=1 Tax=Saccharopolyspora elongata TaxID=2530387 RepID=A0A4R4Y1M8_9PSEU|nr:DUF4232 domain-containing protein [Saccharopolyspora elongata]TDD37946.1 DUF4232 domain-containing protein [Saccharopolyspora elongata]